MLLVSIRRPATQFSLGELAVEGVVSVGRESEAKIKLDHHEVPFLLSRKHATFRIESGDRIILKDLDSTNGTYTARRGERLRKLARGQDWVMMSGDLLGFGGPDTIIVNGAQVPNPFLFKYFVEEQEDQAGILHEVSMATQGNHLVNARPSDQDAMQPVEVEMQPVDEVVGPAGRNNAAGGGPHPRRGTATAGGAGVQEGSVDSPRGGRGGRMRQTLRAHRTAQVANKENEGQQGIAQPAQPGGTPKVKEVLSNHLTCPICCEWLIASHTLMCGHMFCGLCLATWLSHKHSCPTCRKPVVGVPVRCLQVDNTINDLLGINIMSPTAKKERKRKQEQWEDIQTHVVQDWAAAIQRRKESAEEAAERQQRNMRATGGGAAAAAQ